MTSYDAYLRDREADADIAASDPPEAEEPVEPRAEDERAADEAKVRDDHPDTDWAPYCGSTSAEGRWFKGFFLIVEAGGIGYVWSVNRGEPDGDPAVAHDESRSRQFARAYAQEHAADVADIERTTRGAA